MAEPPQILRIKRKRGQDPLQALILEDLQQVKRLKPSSPTALALRTPEPKNWFFELSRTDDSVTAPDPEVLASVLSEALSREQQRQFVIPKQQTEEDTVIPHELAEMLDTFLHVEKPGTRRVWRSGRRQVNETDESVASGESKEPEATDAHESDGDLGDSADYVFDVYRLSSTRPLTSYNYPQSQIGYIRFHDDEEFELLHSDDEAKSEGLDDEDSNAESFYQNDYPEDEDAGTHSDTYEIAEDEAEEDDEVPVIVDSAEAAEGHAYLQGHVQADQAEDERFDDLYDEFFDENGRSTVDFLQQDDDYEDVSFERQSFFPGDHDDELAIHRDKIFGRLQNMIDEE